MEHQILSFSEFISNLYGNPVMIIIVVLILGVIFVNGWTDAPNAIATCVATRSMKVRSAIIMAAVFNLIGVLVMTMINATVVSTIFNMVDFGTNTHEAILALGAALFAIVIWALAAWYYGIPTSESHALIAGLSGAAIALHNSIDGINPTEWIKVLIGLFLSTILGFFMGWLFTKVIVRICSGMDRWKTKSFFKGAQICGGAAMAYMHGAQDGQKFIGVFLLGISLLQNGQDKGDFTVPFWLMILCSVVISLGTSIGGYRIIKSVGMDMVKLESYQGFAADLAAAGCLLLCTLTGAPVSTTHTKTSAIMGVGASKRLSAVNWDVVKEMVLTWILTFPGCGLIGYLMVKLFLFVF